MKDPSVTATSVPSMIDLSTHSIPPDTDMCSHNHVFPHDCSTLRNVDGAGMGLALGTLERRRQCSPSNVGCTEHNIW
jgi:hypothetical protein